MTKKLHIVSFDVPFPANYGGVIDVFYRIKSLHELGVEIYLHCFEYGRGEADELKKYCKEVYYYKRSKRILDFFSLTPFIVKSRINLQLLNRLLENNYPILFEGLHTSWYLMNTEIQKRTTFIRTHNIEHDYYNALALKSKGFKWLFFKLESLKLKKFEKIIKKSDYLLSISKLDLEYFNQYHPKTMLLQPSFETKAIDLNVSSNYILFHGNLGVEENNEAIIWLIENVYSKDLRLPFIIAGKNPSVKLRQLAQRNSIQLIENPRADQMNELISHAKIHLLYSTQSTGIKLKLLAALQSNGIVISNSILLKGSDLESYCEIANSAEEFKTNILRNSSIHLSEEAILKRKELFETKLNVNLNNRKIIDLI